MGLQCFWISIFDHLQRNPADKSGYKIESVKDLRTLVGLTDDTAYSIFDEQDPIMFEALRKLIELLNLQIVVHPIDDSGRPIILPNNLHGGELEACYEFNGIQVNRFKHAPMVHITQHMIDHFQLIVSDQDQSGQVAGRDNHFLVGNQLKDLSAYQETVGILEGWNMASTEIRVLEQDLIRLLDEQNKTQEQAAMIESILIRINELRGQLNKVGTLTSSVPEFSALQTKTGQINEETQRLIAQYGSEDLKAREQLGPRAQTPRSGTYDPQTAALLGQFELEDLAAREQLGALLVPFKVGNAVYVFGNQAFVEGAIPEFTADNSNFNMSAISMTKAKSAIENPTFLPEKIPGEVAKVDRVGDKYYYIIRSRYGWFFNVVENITPYTETEEYAA